MPSLSKQVNAQLFMHDGKQLIEVTIDEDVNEESAWILSSCETLYQILDDIVYCVTYNI